MKSNKSKKYNKQRSTNAESISGKTTDMRGRGKGFKVEREQPKSDSKDPRVNYDNTRVSRFARNFSGMMEEDSKKGNRNDISTWNRNPVLTNSAGSLPFASITGDPFGTANSGASVPGIMSFDYTHTIGSAFDPVAVNKTFEAMYSYMVHANSRNYNYDYTDLAMYCLAACDVFSAIEEVKRVYGVMKSYTEPNRYLVDGLVTALGWDPKDVRHNLSNIWFGLNELITQTRQLWIPNTIPLIQRWVDMNSHVYKDAESARAQMYVFRCTNYWELSQTGVNSGTSLLPALYPQTQTGGDGFTNWIPYCRYKYATASLTTWASFQAMIQRMINNLVASQDRGAIYGDILQAFGAGNIVALQQFDASYLVAPEVNTMIMAQIENINVSSVINTNVVQAPSGRLTIQPIYSYITSITNDDAGYGQIPSGIIGDMSSYDAMFSAPHSSILNFHGEGQPTPEWIMEATRFKIGDLGVTTQYGYTLPTFEDKTSSPVWKGGEVTGSAPSTYCYVPKSASTEVINRITIFTRTDRAVGGWSLSEDVVLQNYSVSETWADKSPNNIFRSMAFDWHPFFYKIPEVSTEAGTVGYPIMDFLDAHGDFDNYIVLTQEELKKLNQTAVYSAFGVPMTIG